MTEADILRVRYFPSGDDIRAALRADSFEQFLRHSKQGRVAAGDEWEEVIGDGSGRTTGITLRVEAVLGGNTLDSGTAFDFRPETGDE